MRSALLLLLVARVASAAPEPRLAIGLDERVGAEIPRQLVLTDSMGRRAPLGQLFDGTRPVVLVMAYAHCTMMCSVVLRGLADAMRSSPVVAGRDYVPVVVSLDPRETVDEAARRQNKLLEDIGRRGDRAAWPYLVGDAPTIAALADGLGFRYAWDPHTQQYAHPAVVFVLTPDGRIAEYLRGVTFDGLAPAVHRAVRGELTRSVAQDLLRCFHFDPALRRYGARIALLYRLGASVVLVSLATMIVALVTWERRRRTR
jgi:protein SCO1/2